MGPAKISMGNGLYRRDLNLNCQVGCCMTSRVQVQFGKHVNDGSYSLVCLFELEICPDNPPSVNNFCPDNFHIISKKCPVIFFQVAKLLLLLLFKNLQNIKTWTYQTLF